jgi:hypothetical protein
VPARLTDELKLWQWRYTDQFGTRRVFPWMVTSGSGCSRGKTSEMAALELAAWARVEDLLHYFLRACSATEE